MKMVRKALIFHKYRKNLLLRKKEVSLLQEHTHGYGITQKTSAMSKGRLILSAGANGARTENGAKVKSRFR